VGVKIEFALFKISHVNVQFPADIMPLRPAQWLLRFAVVARALPRDAILGVAGRQAARGHDSFGIGRER
jgi:hypothetical protein